jgi:hypothetical protein
VRGAGDALAAARRPHPSPQPHQISGWAEGAVTPRGPRLPWWRRRRGSGLQLQRSAWRAAPRQPRGMDGLAVVDRTEAGSK